MKDADASTFLAAVETAMSDALAGADPLREAGRALALAPGAKRARPLLCRAVAGVIGGVDDAAVVRMAACVELVHAASLLHDDVVDDSPLRRGQPTANARAGNAFAVLAGDLVLVRALSLLSEPRALTSALAAVERMSAGALLELRARGDVDTGLPAWRAMAAGKTGALFGLCGQLVALLAGDVDRAARLEHGLSALGVAFQIADDVGDLVGLQGKPALADLRERNPSYPLLVAVAREGSLRDAIAATWRAPDVDERVLPDLAARIVATGACSAAIDEARRCVQDAHGALGPDAAPLQPVLDWALSLVAAPDVARAPHVPSVRRDAA